MESWIQRIFLSVMLTCSPLTAYTQEENDAPEEEKTILDAVIEPDLARRTIKEDKIDTENFEVGLYAGVMSVEDFGSNNVFGVRLAYHISEDWFIESVYGTTNTSESSAESLFAINLVGDDRTLSYYNMSIGVNLFPGEVFLGHKYAFNSNLYLIAGAGNTSFAEDEFFTYNFGGGLRLFITDWAAFRLDFRNHIFTHNILGEDKTIQNLETHLGLSLFF